MTRRILLFCSMLMAWALPAATPVRGDELADLKARFKERYPKLVELQNKGTVGETWDGWVAGVKDPLDAEVKALVEAENADRKTLYALVAEKQNAKPAEVGEVNGVRSFKKAAPEHFLKLKSGEWKQKKDVKVEEPAPPPAPPK